MTYQRLILATLALLLGFGVGLGLLVGPGLHRVGKRVLVIVAALQRRPRAKLDRLGLIRLTQDGEFAVALAQLLAHLANDGAVFGLGRRGLVVAEADL